MGSGSKTTTKTTANNTTTPTVPDWLSSPYQNYYAQVNNLSGMNGSDFTTPATALQNQAFGRAGQGTGNPTGAAQTATANMLGYSPQQVSAGQLRNTDLKPYMNPFQDDVINSTLADFEQGNGVALNQLRSSTPTGAFNGSRAGVAEGTLAGDNTRTLASTLAGLNTANFTQAQGAAGQDIASRLQAALANQGADLSGANLRLGAANQLGQLGLAGAANSRADTQQMADLGAQQRGINQDNNPNVAQSQLLQLLQSLYGITPQMFSGQQSSGTQTSTQSQNGGFMDMLGTLLGGLGGIGFNPFGSVKGGS